MNYTIKKVKIKDRSLTVDMNEIVTGENGSFTNEVTKKCANLAHDDLLKSFDGLVPHLISICDFKGSEDINRENIEVGMSDIFSDYEVTGFSIGGADEKEGVVLIAQRSFPSGKVLNIVTPFTQYLDEDYEFGSELSAAIENCLFETKEYLFNDKFCFKQLEMDFNDEHPEGDKAVEELMKPLKEKIKKSKSKKLAEEAA